MARLTKAQAAEQETHKRELRDLIDAQGATRLYTILRHVSRSGMMRHISVIMVDRYGHALDITWRVSLALGWPEARSGGIKVPGCGMDMGFHLVYSLSATLYGHQDRGAYRLRHEWL